MNGIHSNHFNIKSELKNELISEMFSSFLRHCFTPNSLIGGIINPTLKDRYGNRNNSDNYRPVIFVFKIV